jgi:hypothetical protein
MADPTTNSDGTKQVSAPTRSAFDPPPAAAKAAPVADKTPPPSAHETGMIEHIRGMIQDAMKPKDFVEGGEKVGDAVDKAVGSVPGNHADY